jgi:hypothetical protein
MSRLTAKIKEEVIEMIPPTIYFFVILHIVAFIRVLMNRNTGLPLPTSISITVAALVLGKSVVIADLLPCINRYPQKPLIWNVCWKTTIYFFVALLVHYLEHLYDFWKEAPGFVAANQKLLAEIVWPHFWAIQILLALLIGMYCVMGELVRLIGADKIKAIFFGPLPANPV